MKDAQVMDALEHLESMNDIVMDRIANFIKANIDDFMECFEVFCPECNGTGWDADNGMMKCDNGHSWFPEK